jgi:hypothetical protein
MREAFESGEHCLEVPGLPAFYTAEERGQRRSLPVVSSVLCFFLFIIFFSSFSRE